MSTRLKSVYFQKPAIFVDMNRKRHGTDHLDAGEHGFEILSHEGSRMVTITQGGKLVYRCPYEGIAGEVPDAEGIVDIHTRDGWQPPSNGAVHSLTGLTHSQADAQSAAAKRAREEREAHEKELAEIEDGKRAQAAAAPQPTAAAINIDDPMEDEAMTATEAASAPAPVELPPEPTPRSAEAAMEDEAPTSEPAGDAPASPSSKKKGKAGR